MKVGGRAGRNGSSHDGPFREKGGCGESRDRCNQHRPGSLIFRAAAQKARAVAIIEVGLVTYLKAAPGLAALIGTRVYPQHAPQGADYPRLLYRVTSEERKHSLQGAAGFTVARVQLDCQGRGPTSYADAKAVEEQLRQALDGFRGLWGAWRVQFCFFEDSPDDYEPPASADEAGVDDVGVMIRAGFDEAVPPLP